MSSALVISASYDKQIRFWDAASGRTVRCFAFQDSQVNTLLLIQDTQALVVGGFGVLRVYDITSIVSASSNPIGGTTAAAGGAPAGAAAASTQGQAPPLLSSYESQGSMNFTSLGYFPLRRPQDTNFNASGNGHDDDDDDSNLTDSSSVVDVLGGTSSILITGSLHQREVGFVLYATSEDGHIRFFDAKSPSALRQLKDIYTGAAITCSCLSADRRLLLTGSQIGVVSVWHVPSIVASASLENSNGAVPAGGAGDDAEDTARRHAHAEIRKTAALFGSKPLQEISFDTDYSAVRSIAMDPLARWAVVATNAGNVHFLRFSHDAHLLGTKAAVAKVSFSPTAAAAAAATSAAAVPVPRSAFGMQTEGGVASAIPSSSSNNGALDMVVGGGSESHSSHGPREGVYRSALVVNELSQQAYRVSQTDPSPLSGVRQSGVVATESSGAFPRHSNSIGTAILDTLEQKNLSCPEGRRHSDQATGGTGGTGAAATADDAADGAAADVEPPTPAEVTAPAKLPLQEKLELEVFYSFQAHYKYILKVAISPDGEVLATCSADYTVGRFLIPPVLREAAGVTSEFASMPGSALLPSTGAIAARDSDSADRARDVAALAGPSAVAAAPPPPLQQPEATSAAQAEGEPSAPAAVSPVTEPPAESAVANDTAAAPAAAAAAGADTTTSAAPPPPAPSASENSSQEKLSLSTNQPRPQQHYLFKPLKPLVGHNRWVWDCVFSDCCRYLFTASSDAQVRMWNGLTTDKAQSTGFVGHTKPVVAILLCYDRSRS